MGWLRGPDEMPTSLLLIDVQYDFLDFRGPVGSVGAIAKISCLPGLRELIIFARCNCWQIVHVVTKHEDATTLPRRLLERGVPTFCVEDTLGSEIVTGLYQASDVVVNKQSFDGFLNTNLDEIIRGSEIVIIGGLAADCCVFLTAATASNSHSKDVYLPYQAISASTPESWLSSLRTAEKSFATVIDLRSLISGAIPAKHSVKRGADHPSSSAWFVSMLESLDRAKTQAQWSEGTGIKQMIEDLERRVGDCWKHVGEGPQPN